MLVPISPHLLELVARTIVHSRWTGRHRRCALAVEEIRRTPPYGPARGMLEGLRLLQRTSPNVVDQELLRSQGIARGNEYKVVGALRYLGLIDEDGRPTDRARLLKARGPLLTLNLQQI